MSTAYYTRRDGQTKRTNQCLEMCLRWQLMNLQRKMVQLAISWILEPHYGILPDPVNTSNSIVQDVPHERRVFTDFLKQHLLKARQKMKQNADANKTTKEFQTEDSVFLKIQPYKQALVAKMLFPWTSLKVIWTYVIMERVGPVAYKLKLPPVACPAWPIFRSNDRLEEVRRSEWMKRKWQNRIS